MTKLQKLFSAASAFAAVIMTSGVAFAAEGVASKGDGAWMAAAIAIGIGLAAIGGTFSQAKVGAAALEGIARNPQAADKIFTPMIIGLALIESLCIYGLLIAIFLNGKI